MVGRQLAASSGHRGGSTIASLAVLYVFDVSISGGGRDGTKEEDDEGEGGGCCCRQARSIKGEVSSSTSGERGHHSIYLLFLLPAIAS